ncbi:MAG: SapB/AmfS family lanthipeptide [Gemmatimonadota bacterium]
MALLDIQVLEPVEGGHGGGGSHLSLLLCDSLVSVTLC